MHNTKDKQKEIVNSNNQRLVWLDQARGFCILLVLLGHIQTTPSTLWALIYTFHMPLFFVISGYLWDDKNLFKYSFKVFLYRKFNKLIVPYFKIAGVCLILWGGVVPIITSVFSRDKLEIDSYLLQLCKYLYGILYSIGDVDCMPNCSPIWFLTAFFCSNIFWYLYRKTNSNLKHGKFNLMVLFLIALLGYSVSLIQRLPWNINSAIIGCYFMGVGYEIKKLELYKYTRYCLFIPIVLGIYYFFNHDIPYVGMAKNIYEGYWLILLISSMTCLFYIQVFYNLNKYLTRCTFLKNVSQNSIGYFGYDGSTKILGSIPVVGTYWICFWFVKIVVLSSFVKAVNKFNIRKYFY